MSDPKTEHTINIPDIKKDYFSLFKIPRSFAVDSTLLENSYLVLQKQVHPDQFVTKSQLYQQAIQYASIVNAAYDTLKSPFKRAVYLLELSNINIDFSAATIQDTAFLMEQMEWREKITDTTDRNTLNEVRQIVQKQLSSFESQLKSLWCTTSEANLKQAFEITQKMHFLHKISEEIHKKEIIV